MKATPLDQVSHGLVLMFERDDPDRVLAYVREINAMEAPKAPLEAAYREIIEALCLIQIYCMAPQQQNLESAYEKLESARSKAAELPPQLNMLVEWFLGIARLLAIYPPGGNEVPPPDAAVLLTPLEHFENTARIATVQNIRRYTGLALSLTAEIYVWLGEPEKAVARAAESRKYLQSERGNSTRVPRRRLVNKTILESGGASARRLCAYHEYLYGMGDLLL